MVRFRRRRDPANGRAGPGSAWEVGRMVLVVAYLRVSSVGQALAPARVHARAGAPSLGAKGEGRGAPGEESRRHSPCRWTQPAVGSSWHRASKGRALGCGGAGPPSAKQRGLPWAHGSGGPLRGGPLGGPKVRTPHLSQAWAQVDMGRAHVDMGRAHVGGLLRARSMDTASRRSSRRSWHRAQISLQPAKGPCRASPEPGPGPGSGLPGPGPGRPDLRELCPAPGRALLT